MNPEQLGLLPIFNDLCVFWGWAEMDVHELGAIDLPDAGTSNLKRQLAVMYV